MATNFRIRSFKVSWECVCDQKSYNGFNVALCAVGDSPNDEPIKSVYVKPVYRADGRYSYTFKSRVVAVGDYEVWVQAVSFGSDSFWRSAGGLEIPDDDVGTIAAALIIFSINVSSPVVFKNSPDATTSGTHSNIKITGRKLVGNTYSNYGYATFTGNGDAEAGTAVLTPFTTSIPNNAGKSSYTINLYDSATKDNLVDTMEIPVIFRGATGASITTILSNPAHTVPTSNTGTVSSYVGSGTNLYIYDGSTLLDFVTGSLTPGTFSVQRAGDGITPGGTATPITSPIKGVSFSAASAMTAGLVVLTATINYTVSICRLDGSLLQIPKTQVITKSIAGDTGNTGATGATGSKGDTGNTGPSGSNTALVYLYQRGTSAPTKPTDTLVYTFSTALLSGGSIGSWSQTVPPSSNGQNLYVIVATATSTATFDYIYSTEWTTPVILSRDGLHSASVRLYKRSSTVPSIPTGDLTYTFSTGMLSTVGINGWSQTTPNSDGNPLYSIVATAASTSDTDTITTSEWSAPTILVQDGSRGAGNFYGTVASAAWSDASANTKISAVTASSTKKTGDVCTLTYSESGTIKNVYTKMWDGTAWADPGQIIDGNLFVTGSIKAVSVDTTGLTIKNASGVTKVSADASGNLMLSGDIVLEGGDVYGKAGKFSALHGSSNAGSASCYCYASDYTKPYLYGAAALRSAWSNALDEAVGGAGSWIVYSVLAEGSDYDGIPYSSTIRGTINGSQTFILSQNECTFRGKIKGIRSVNTGSLTDAAMHLTASFGALVFDSDANKCISWNDGSSLALRSGHRTSGNVDAVTIAGDGAVKIICNTDAQDGFCGIYVAPKTMTAGASPSWVYNVTVSSTNGVQINGNTVWHAGNDGSGSGLDADKMDGQDSSYYLNYSNFSGTVAFSAIPTGTTASTVAIGNHTHTGLDAATLGGYSSASFPVLNTTTVSDKFLYIERSTYYALYVNQTGTGHYAIFFNGVSGATTGSNEIILEKTGNIVAVSFTGSGANLNNLNATNLASGTVPIARIPTGTDSSTVSLGNHGHNYAGSGSDGGAATSVANSMVLKIAGGSVEGTSLYTFNGSAGKTLNFVAGSNITLTAAAGSLTIANSYVYTHPTSGVTAGTFKSVTVDANGHVTAGTNPTTLSGYGITDAAASSHTHSYVPLSGGTMSGAITMNGNSIWSAYEIACSVSMRPASGTTTATVGTAASKFSAVYATNGTIQTSDARKKTDVREFSEQEIAVAVELSKKIGIFQFLSAVSEKGASSARLHIGMTVQSVAAIFEAHGLDPWRYGFMCHDTWESSHSEDSGESVLAGDEFAFRPDQLAFFISAGINERLKKLEVLL